MQPSTKHAISNPTLWINLSCLLSALIATAMKDEWVKHYPLAIVILGTVNFSATALLQYLRDLKKHPDGEDNGDNVDRKDEEKNVSTIEKTS